MRKFSLSLDRALRSLSEEMEEQQPGAGQGDPTKDPNLAAGMKSAQNKATASAQANAPATGPGQDANSVDGKQVQDQKAVADQQKQKVQGQQLGQQMNTTDKEILQLQAKVTGGASKPADLAKLNTLLTAKKAVQDKFMRNYGVQSV